MTLRERMQSWFANRPAQPAPQPPRTMPQALQDVFANTQNWRPIPPNSPLAGSTLAQFENREDFMAWIRSRPNPFTRPPRPNPQQVNIQAWLSGLTNQYGFNPPQ